MGERVIHLDLFSGIGGFALAVDEVWPGAEHIFCEIDPYCRALLKKRFEGSVIYGDIRGLTADAASMGCYSGKYQREGIQRKEQACGKIDASDKPQVYILTAGVPCQPASCAGKRRGTEDDRWLWPEAFRVIKEFTPQWCILENVRGLLTLEKGLVFDALLSEMENIGYEVQPFIIPAVAVGAPHRRDRVWFVANSVNEGCVGRSSKSHSDGERVLQDKQTGQETWSAVARCDGNAPDTINERLQGGKRPGTLQAGREATHGATAERCGDTAWEQNWLEVATCLCRVDDGLSARVDGLKLSKARHRVERLKALGNSIVPQVAIEIMRAIRATEPART